jgi:SMODS-associated and fused to various effectors sensor domain
LPQSGRWLEASPIIRNVEVVQIIRRAEAGDGFFVVPLAAGGLDYVKAAEATSNHLSAQRLSDWNMQKMSGDTVLPATAAEVARRVLVQRLQAIHCQLSQGESLRLGLFARKAPPFEPGVSLALDWSSHFAEKETNADVWRTTLLLALERIAGAIRQHAPGREVEAFGLPTLPAAAALGSAFLSTSGLGLAWRQFMPDRTEQLWSLSQARVDTGFKATLSGKDPTARDIAVLVSVAENTEPLFAAYQNKLALRALVHIAKPGNCPHRLNSPGEAADVAYVVQEAMRAARRDYGDIGTVHLFMAVPAGLAVLIGQLLNTFGSVQTYEHVTIDGSGQYRPAALLRP